MYIVQLKRDFFLNFEVWKKKCLDHLYFDRAHILYSKMKYKISNSLTKYCYRLTLGVWNSKQQKCDSNPETHLKRIISKFWSRLKFTLVLWIWDVVLAVGHLNKYTQTNNFLWSTHVPTVQGFFHKLCLLVFILLALYLSLKTQYYLYREFYKTFSLSTGA